jgi:predicted RNA binding protein YcfA (HicA-like mRNA interferase family)
MAPPVPALTGRRLIKALNRAGFAVVRVKGSHHMLADAHGRQTTVPVHAAETIGPGLLSKILRDCGLNRHELEKIL